MKSRAVLVLLLIANITITPSLVSANENSVSEYSAVNSVLQDYLNALDSANAEPILRLTHNAWHHKLVGEEMTTIDKSQLAGCIGSNACALTSGSDYQLTTLQIFYNNFAIARLDNRAAYSASLVTLFKNNGGWKVANQITLDGSHAKREPHFTVSDETEATLTAMHDYYTAVEFGRVEPLQALFHPDWHMKNPEGGAIVAEDKPTFLRRIDKRPSNGYYDNRYTTDITIIFDRLAMLRVDNPETRSSTIFTFIRINKAWQMVDKAWSIPN